MSYDQCFDRIELEVCSQKFDYLNTHISILNSIKVGSFFYFSIKNTNLATVKFKVL